MEFPYQEHPLLPLHGGPFDVAFENLRAFRGGRQDDPAGATTLM